MFKIFAYVPLLIIPVAIYFIFALMGVNFNQSSPLLSLSLASGATWLLTEGDLVVILGILAIYIEIFKATRSNNASIFEHMTSTFLFVILLVCFLIWDLCGNSTFFMLLLLSLIDLVGGFTISISTARRDIGTDEHGL